MKKQHVKIGGKTFALAFTLNALCEFTDTIPGFDLSKLSEYIKTPRGLLDILFELARQGEALEGRVLDVDKNWFGLHIPPSPQRIAAIQIAVLNALAAGIEMETDDGSDGAETDEVLEEIKKKDRAAD